MPMYGLLEHRSNYSDTTGSLWFYSKDKATSFNVDIANTDDFKSFIYKAKLLGGRGSGGEGTVAFPDPNQANGIPKIATIVVS